MTRFLWRVAVRGYQWTADDYLFAPEGSRFREYAPLEDFTGLFRAFAETPITMNGLLGFANKFGHLGTGAGGVGGDIDDEWESRSDADWQGLDHTEKSGRPDWEDMDFWCEQIGRMRDCVRTWDKVQNGKADQQAMLRLQVTVSNSLRGRVRVAFGRDPEQRVGGFLLQIVPNTLLGALWLQLAETISGYKQHRACAACGNWFEVSPEKFRKSRHYCSEPCRSRAYRSRKEKARQLANEGKTAKKIAALLGSDAKTIRGWLMAGP
jgi:hypothetical protein